jgi:hypothetical protein
MSTVTEQVQRGAALLDEKIPGWEDEIDLTRLTISDPRWCIGGQLGTRRKKLVPYSDTMEMLGLSRPVHADYGFCLGGCDYDYGDLTQAWREMIAGRRLSRSPRRLSWISAKLVALVR